jgi:hypothetical protein
VRILQNLGKPRHHSSRSKFPNNHLSKWRKKAWCCQSYTAIHRATWTVGKRKGEWTQNVGGLQIYKWPTVQFFFNVPTTKKMPPASQHFIRTKLFEAVPQTEASLLNIPQPSLEEPQFQKASLLRPNWCFSEFLLIRKWFIPDILSWIQECVFSYICWKSLWFGKTQQRIHRVILLNYISYINIRFSLDNFVMALREFPEFNQKKGYKYYYVGSWVSKKEHPFKSH